MTPWGLVNLGGGVHAHASPCNKSVASQETHNALLFSGSEQSRPPFLIVMRKTWQSLLVWKNSSPFSVIDNLISSADYLPEVIFLHEFLKRNVHLLYIFYFLFYYNWDSEVCQLYTTATEYQVANAIDIIQHLQPSGRQQCSINALLALQWCYCPCTEN